MEPTKLANLLVNTAAGTGVDKMVLASTIGTTGVRLMGFFVEPLQTVPGLIQDFTAKTMS